MRGGHVLALLAALAVAGGCRPEAPVPAPSTTTPKPAAPAPAKAPAARPAPTRDAVFGRPQLDQMLAPIALYPDALLAQVLMASTYPGDVAEAVAWSRAHPKVMGEDAVRRVADMPWDPSVQALAAFPQTLAMLGQNLAWVQNLGDAYLAQPRDVAASIQRLRRKAQQAGFLGSNPYQVVRTAPRPRTPGPAIGPPPAPVADEGLGNAQEEYTEDIYIEPVDEEMVYVPSYDPNEVYGTWEDPYYEPIYYAPPAGYYLGGALAAGLAFGVGVAIIDSLWGDIDWNGGDIDIDLDRYNRAHVDHRRAAGDNHWRHDPVNRDGVPYRDRVNRERYDRQLDGAASRDAFRGDDPERMRAREQARATMQRSGFDAPARSHREAVEDARAAELEAANARERAMAVERDRERERERTRMAQVERERAQAAERERVQLAERERQQEGERQRARQHEHERQRARQHQAAEQQRRARDNAFDGARQPQRSREDYDRGRASQAHRGSYGGGRQVSRPAGRPSRR